MERTSLFLNCLLFIMGVGLTAGGAIYIHNSDWEGVQFSLKKIKMLILCIIIIYGLVVPLLACIGAVVVR